MLWSRSGRVSGRVVGRHSGEALDRLVLLPRRDETSPAYQRQLSGGVGVEPIDGNHWESTMLANVADVVDEVARAGF